jgi:hypothetical protein
MNDLSVLLSQLSCGDDEQAEQALSHLASWGQKLLIPAGEAIPSGCGSTLVGGAPWLRIHDESISELLAQALADPDKSVRWCAGLALRKNPSPEAGLALIGLLAEKDALTRRLAGDALVAIGSQAVPQLLEAMQHGDQSVRIETVRALAKIGDQRAIPAIRGPGGWLSPG